MAVRWHKNVGTVPLEILNACRASVATFMAEHTDKHPLSPDSREAPGSPEPRLSWG